MTDESMKEKQTENGDTELASLRRQIAAANAAILEAFEHGVCVKARYTTRGDKWRATHAEAINRARRTIP
jgi:IMP cyclohydrolase